MVKTNSKQAREAIKKYVTENFMTYDFITYSTFEETAAALWGMFKNEYWNGNTIKYYRYNRQEAFLSWAQGLSGGGVFDFWTYSDNNNPVEILGDALQQTESERAKYTEEEASAKLTYLIYREVIAVVERGLLND